MDANWPDTWVEISGTPPTDLFNGDSGTALGRVCLTRHPLTRGVKVAQGQKLPGAINMSYADGHAGKLLLQNIKTVIWHLGYLPTGNPWALNLSSVCPAPLAGRLYARRGASNTFLTFSAIAPMSNGFCKNSTPSGSTPWWAITSAL